MLVDPRGTVVSGDPDRLRQVLWNLARMPSSSRNAADACRSGSERVNDHIELTVSDDGIGFHRNFFPQLFERFSQADAGTNRVHGGLGLGLAISRHLVELQGGCISAHSDGPRKGATFDRASRTEHVLDADGGELPVPCDPRVRRCSRCRT